MLVTEAAREEAEWWARNIARLSGQPIWPRPFDATVDGDIASDASDTGVGAFLSATSTPSMAGLPLHLLEASSTLRELWGISTFNLAVAPSSAEGASECLWTT